MEVVIKPLYRADALRKSENPNLYLELDGTVLVHYRDLQIEFDVKEFEKFASTLAVQAAELAKIIQGMGAETASENVKIWSSSELPPEASRHPRQVALDECTDGYHLSFRNYKLVLSKQDIFALKRALKTTDVETPLAATFQEFQKILDVNKIGYTLAEEKGAKVRGKEAQRITVSENHVSKVRRILTGLGFEGRVLENQSHVYAGEQFSVELVLAGA